MRLSILLAVFVAVLGLNTAVASEEEHEAEFKKNVLAGFIGLANEDRRNGLALGAEYERRITESVGIRFLVEHTYGDLDYWVIAFPMSLTVGNWRWGFGPGVEITEEGSFSLARLTVGYTIEKDRMSYAPALAIDFVDGEQAYVLGIAVGFDF